MQFVPDPQVKNILKNYPVAATKMLQELRQLIVKCAEENDMVERLTETVKWGEPSYLTRYGSTIRMDWKAKNPDQCYLYFICTTSLVETFKFIYGEELKYEDNRAIILEINEPIPVEPLKKCIDLALSYKKIKHLPMLGV